MTSIKARLGTRIRSIRERKGWSQEKLAAECGLHRTYIGSIERGERNVAIVNVERIATALELAIEDLFEDAPVRERARRTSR